MTAKTPAQLLTVFETGDVPQQTDYQDVFDSFVNLVQTAAQSIASDLTLPTLNAQKVSAADILTGTNLTVASANISNLNTSTVSAANITSNIVSAQALYASAATFNSVTAQSVVASAGAFTNVTAQSIITSALTVTVLKRPVDTSVRAIGTTQGTAKQLTADFNRVVSGSAADNYGVLLSNNTGREQLVFNDTNINISTYPISGGAINDLGTNNPYVVSASLAVSFYYLGANIYLSK